MPKIKKRATLSFIMFLLIANILFALWSAEQTFIARDISEKNQVVIIEGRKDLMESVIDAYISAKIAQWVYKDALTADRNANSKKEKESI